MSLQVHPSIELANERWDALVEGSPDGWVFALKGWQRLIEAVPRWKLQDHGFFVTDGPEPVAVVPLHFNPEASAMSSSGWGLSGPVLAGALRPCKRERVMALCIEECIRRATACGAGMLDVGQSPVTRTSLEAAWGVSPFQALGWRDESGLSQVIDLSADPEVLWHAVKPKVRREIERARAAGLHAAQLEWVSSVDAYYAMHAETYRRTGVSPHPREYFAGIAHEMAPRGNALLWAALDASGQPLAFHNVARFGAGAYYHTGCSLSELPHPAVGHLLFWEVLLGMRQAGVRWYDCGNVDPGARSGKIAGLSLFKTRFGGELHRSFRMREVLGAHTCGEGGRVDPAREGNATRIRERLLRSLGSGWRSWIRRRAP